MICSILKTMEFKKGTQKLDFPTTKTTTLIIVRLVNIDIDVNVRNSHSIAMPRTVLNLKLIYLSQWVKLHQLSNTKNLYGKIFMHLPKLDYKILQRIGS